MIKKFMVHGSWFMAKICLSVLFFLLTMSYRLPTAHAVCPVCTVAVGAGLGLARYFGVDDTISGVWIGGIILSSSFWLSDWLNKKYFSKHPTSKLPLLTSHLTLLTSILMYLLVLAPLYFTQTIGHPFNTILGIDKLVFGTIAGSLTFLLAVRADKLVREIRGKQLFYYQKVVFPLTSLIITSGLFYFLIK